MRDRLGKHAGGQKKGGADGPESCRSWQERIEDPPDHLITDRTGLPLPVGISRANLHDSPARKPLARGIPPIPSGRGRSRRLPAKLHPDKGYDYDHLRRRLHKRRIIHRITRKGVESSTRLGRHRCRVERTVA